MTIHDKLKIALERRNFKVHQFKTSAHYTIMVKEGLPGAYLLGVAGACRFSKTGKVSQSFPVEKTKAKLLAEFEQFHHSGGDATGVFEAL